MTSPTAAAPSTGDGTRVLCVLRAAVFFFFLKKTQNVLKIQPNTAMPVRSPLYTGLQISKKSFVIWKSRLLLWKIQLTYFLMIIMESLGFSRLAIA